MEKDTSLPPREERKRWTVKYAKPLYHRPAGHEGKLHHFQTTLYNVGHSSEKRIEILPLRVEPGTDSVIRSNNALIKSSFIWSNKNTQIQCYDSVT